MTPNRISGTVVEASIDGRTLRFFVNNPEDLVQRHHLRGEFYEPEELRLMASQMTPETCYVDIGANVGNHILWLYYYAGLRDIVAVEPNPLAIAILETNLRLNGLFDRVDRSLIGYGVSDKPGQAVLEIPRNNLGGAKFRSSTAAGIPLETGDELLGDRQVDFLKIDVEGMEIKCLRGLSRTIQRCRPRIFVEVDKQNMLAFSMWIKSNDYVVVDRYKRYTANENFLLMPAA